MTLEEWATEHNLQMHDDCIEFPIFFSRIAEMCARKANEAGCDVQLISGTDDDGVRYWAVTENFPKEI